MLNIHHHLGLRIRVQHFQDIHIYNRIKFIFSIFRAIIEVGFRNIVFLPFQFIYIKSESSSEIENSSLKQIV